jgi:uncharacterized coiled-coil DUF342 family protein
MAGQEVTFDDVARAAKSLQEDGEPVTIEAVQDFLGEGSPSTIFKHLAAWRATHVKPAAPPKAELPKELLAGLADWALKFAEQAGAGDREALARNEADIEALSASSEALEGERDALRAEVANVTAASEEAIAERDETIERLNAELKNARQVAMDALVSKAKDQLAIDGKEQQLTQLRQELERKIADMAAESDARLRAEMELVGATTARDSLSAELDDLRAKLDKSTAERSKLRAEVSELKAKK